LAGSLARDFCELFRSNDEDSGVVRVVRPAHAENTTDRQQRTTTVTIRPRASMSVRTEQEQCRSIHVSCLCRATVTDPAMTPRATMWL
jgi:hypothetical protein